jgi:hypothetical protein
MRLLLFCAFAAMILSAFQKPAGERSRIIKLKVDGSGLISDGLVTISSDDLANYISERLFKSYMGTGKMYDRILVEKVNGEPEPEILQILLKEITSGQKKALTDLCLHRYSKPFETLKGKQQAKIRRQFPVLFQHDFT